MRFHLIENANFYSWDSSLMNVRMLSAPFSMRNYNHDIRFSKVRHN